MRQDTRDLTITLTADEANAVVEATCLAILCESGELDHASMNSPGDLSRLGRRAARVGSLANVGDALAWRTHWGPLGGTPDAVTAPEAVWLDLLGELKERAIEMDSCEVEEGDQYEFDAAARTVARAFADAELVAA